MLYPNFEPFPVLETERLILRPLSAKDASDLYHIRSNRIVNKFLRRSKPLSPDHVHRFIDKVISYQLKHEWLFWVICNKNNHQFIGNICFWNIIKEFDLAELGYELLPEFFNQGFMSEAMSAVLNYGQMTLQLALIEAWTHKDNFYSLKLLNKFNFSRDPELEEKLIGSPELLDYIILAKRF